MLPASGCHTTFTFFLLSFHPPESTVRHSGTVTLIRKCAGRSV
jgi:hypothetical protein